jgi:predicted phosphoribosyltransferase
MIKNRIEAGKQLAEKLFKLLQDEECIVLAIPRGGVVVGNEIAKKLGSNLDVVVSKKITPPSSPEYAIGAITFDGTIYVGPYWKQFSNEPYFENEIEKKKIEVKRRLKKYQIKGKTVILVDDGVATGATVFVLLKWLSKLECKRIILAIPVIPSQTFEQMSSLVDNLIAIMIPQEFSAVGQFYREFDQVSDKEVLKILKNYKQS